MWVEVRLLECVQLCNCHLFSSRSLRSCMHSREREAGWDREW